MEINQDSKLEASYKERIKKLFRLLAKYSKCDDSFFGRINGKSVKWESLRGEPIEEANPEDGKWIAVVLESPHVHEYEIEQDKPIGPAQNKTGDNLRKMLPSKLVGFLDSNVDYYNVLVMNSIQYQTSVGLDTKVFRDRVWLSVWLEGGREYFLKRLRKYNPCIIINACTKGDHSLDPFRRGKWISFKYIKEICPLIEKAEGSKSLLMKESPILIFNKNYIKGSSYTIQGFVQTAINSIYNELNQPSLYCISHPSSPDFCSEDCQLEEINPSL